MCWASGNGVSPSAAGRGEVWRGSAGLGWAWHGDARQGLRWQHGGLTGLPCRLHWRTRRGSAWRGCTGQATERRGMARQGSQTVARRASAFPATLTRVDTVWLGHAGRGRARRGRAWRCLVLPGWAWAADSSTELFRRLPAALIRGQTRQDQAWHAAVRHGLAGHGSARPGMG